MRTLPPLIVAFGLFISPFQSSTAQTAADAAPGLRRGGPSSRGVTQIESGARLSGTVFDDVNKDGIHGIAEPGLANWKLLVSGIHSDSVLTDASGKFQFGNLPPGSYVLREQAQTGWTQTFPGWPGTYFILIAPGDTSNHTGYDFGNHLPRFVAESFIGDDGHGHLTGSGGTWNFDTLSAAQRTEPTSCDNTILNEPGEMLTMQGWTTAPSSTSPPQDRNFEASYGRPHNPNFGGGVLTFYQTGIGFAPHQQTVALSPEIDLAQLGDTSFGQLELSFDYFADAGSDSLNLVITTRFFAGFWRDTTDEVFPISTGGTNNKQVPLPVPPNATKVQVGVGVQNPSGNAKPVNGPAVDKVKVKKNVDEATKYKYIPDISQGDSAWCQPSAFANCLIWWSQNGYPELAPSTGTQEEKNTKVQQDLVKNCVTKKRHDMGVVDYLKEKKVYGANNLSGGRKPLEYIKKLNRGSTHEATWQFLKAQFEAGNDVLLRVQWYDKDDKLIDSSAAHYVTVAAVQDSAGKKSLRAANPWGDSHHTVDSTNRDEAYDKFDVTLNPDGTIRIHNGSIIDGAAGIENASYCCVQDICVIRPKQAPVAVPGVYLVSRNAGPARSFSADSVSYGYTVLNSGPGKVNFVVLAVEVPYSAVVSPPGWTSVPLPVQYPGFEGLCSFTVAQQGIAWYTSTNPILPGDSLSGFSFGALSMYPDSSNAIVSYTESDSADGVFALVSGPVLPVKDVTNSMTDGWDMVSVPVVAFDQSKSTLFPTAISPAFTYQGSYVVQTSLQNGVGYWLKFAGTQNVTVSGTPIGEDTVGITKGWNMVGSISSPVAVSAITSVPGGITTSPFFGFAGSYLVTDSLRPGRAYWVRAGSAGELIFSATGAAAPSARIRIVQGQDLPPPPPGNGVASNGAGLPSEFALHQNYPNPFNPTTLIRYDIPGDSRVVLKVFDVYGRLVNTLVDGYESAGYKSVGFGAGNLASGVYFYRLQAGRFADVRKMLILR